MYPIYSTLRRLSSACVYASKEMLVVEDSILHARIGTASRYLDLGEGRWLQTAGLVPMTQVVSHGSSAAEVAISVSRKETSVAKDLGLVDELYTLLYGEDLQRIDAEGRFIRTCRIAVVQGVYRVQGGAVRPAPAETVQRITFRKARPDSVLLS